MATLSDLTETIAKVTCLPEATVFAYGRFAREAGLIAQGGRGRGGAAMSARDAANFLIAVCGTDITRDGPEAIKKFRHAKGHYYPPLTLNLRRFDPSFQRWVEPLCVGRDSIERKVRLEFGDLLEMVVEMAGSGELEVLLRHIPTFEFSDSYMSRRYKNEAVAFDPDTAAERKLVRLTAPGEIELGVDVSIDLSFSRSHEWVQIKFEHLWGYGNSDFASFKLRASSKIQAPKRGPRDLDVSARITETTLLALGGVLRGKSLPEALFLPRAEKRLKRALHAAKVSLR